MNHLDPMKYCPECHKEMVVLTQYSKYCSEIGEMVTVKNCRPYLACPDGCIAHVPGEAYIDGYRQEIQRRIESWILEGIRSFSEFSEKFYTRRQAFGYVKRQSRKVECEDKRFDPKVINSVFDWFCFHVCICGQKFYLRKSVEKYCETGRGWFHLSEGF